MDFHLVAETAIDGRWRVWDATRLAPRPAMVRIATGRDAADVAFATVLGGAVSMTTMEITAVAGGDLPADEGGLQQHPADFGTDVANRMESDGLLRTLEVQRRRVLDALARLDDGRYGRCAVCGREIDDERLEARPEATTCREHADAGATAL
jgi:DnaK suppressor protein